ncbi:MAG: 3-methyl-2-oxobutanoate hydroxymethyltransferase [Gemmatimonadota bacterium]
MSQPPLTDGRAVTFLDLAARKRAAQKIVVLTCYDALFARLLDDLADVLLVGDSVNQVLAGHETTLSATLDQMIYHAASVRRGTRRALVVVDMPFLTYQISAAEAVRNAGRILQESNAHGVKVEGGRYLGPTIEAIVKAGIPVMGHLGLTPQSVNTLGGYRVQGREEAVAKGLIEDARAVEAAGAQAIVLELVPTALAQRITAALTIPTIGIGAGPECDGQVLVLHDMLGLNEGFAPKFLKHYARLADTVRDAARQFGAEVRDGSYPGKDHSFE